MNSKLPFGIDGVTDERCDELYNDAQNIIVDAIEKAGDKGILGDEIINAIYEATIAETMKEYLFVGMLSFHILTRMRNIQLAMHVIGKDMAQGKKVD